MSNPQIQVPQSPRSTPSQVDTFYLTYVDGIDTEKVKHIVNVCNNIIDQVKPKSLYFLISSNGGDVDSGIALYNFLKSLPIRVVMHNIGSIDSIANVVFLAGGDRYASKHTSFLFHGVNMRIKQPVPLGLNQLKEITNKLKISQDKIAGIVSENTSITKEQINKLFEQGKTEGVQFALNKGIISAEKPAKIPKGAPSLGLNYIPPAPIIGNSR